MVMGSPTAPGKKMAPMIPSAAQRTSSQPQHRGLHQELATDQPRGRPQRLAQADLTDALGDRDKHDVHDADATDKQRDSRDAPEQNGQCPVDGGSRSRATGSEVIVKSASAAVVMPCAPATRGQPPGTPPSGRRNVRAWTMMELTALRGRRKFAGPPCDRHERDVDRGLSRGGGRGADRVRTPTTVTAGRSRRPSGRRGPPG